MCQAHVFLRHPTPTPPLGYTSSPRFFVPPLVLREVNATMMDLSEEARKGEGVAHALGVVKAYHMGDYCTFFRLYFAAPSMSS